MEAIEDRQAHSGRWKNLAIGFGIWTIVGLSFGTRSYLQAQFNGTPLSVSESVLSYMVDFYFWGVASPTIFRLCRRYPIERGVLLKRFLFHMVVGLIFVLILTAAAILATWYMGLANRTTSPTLVIFFGKLMLNPFMVNQGLLAYWGTVIVAHAYEYYRQVQISRIRTSELSAQLAQAQLAALKMQIHPHFLFNTLNSISALLHKDVETADRMIARLSEFLRATLKSSDISVVTLKQEIEFMQTYLEIEKIRFQDRLIVDIDVEPAALEAKVPNLILQPLVENAVRHGIGRKASAEHLEITAWRAGDRLLITIEDNGPGLSAKGKNGENGINGSSGIGLLNTRARLKKFYDDFVFEVSDKEGAAGAVVNMNVPYLI
jgi:two-component system LytT family sensor kinase